MGEMLKFLSTNSYAAIVFSIATLVLVIVISVLCAVAFSQGRSISFWPPSIGERPKPQDTPANAKINDDLVTSPRSNREERSPVVDRGTTLTSASGAITITSDFYGGANATLYKATGPTAQAVIAKVYWRGLAPNSPAWQLFQQEQRAAEILNHRNIVKTLDRGLRSGYPFTIMEYLGGGTLRDWIRTHHRLPGKDILSVASQLAQAIDFAHSRGVIHRDIKPGNILFESDPDGRVALSDFGIAAMLGAVERDITAAGEEFRGSPAYVAPEVIRGTAPSRRADIYSFGVVLYEMICGREPFDEQREAFATLMAKLEHDAPDIRTLRPDCPAAIAVYLERTLSRDKSVRPDSAMEIVSHLQEELVRL